MLLNSYPVPTEGRSLFLWSVWRCFPWENRASLTPPNPPKEKAQNDRSQQGDGQELSQPSQQDYFKLKGQASAESPGMKRY
jgi:hypothetical protein